MSQTRRRPGKRVTLEDVARDARVSRATASLVLRESPLVAKETRAKVLASMQRLGYVYNRAAAMLRTRRSQAIGLVITDITNPFFAQMTVGSESYLERADQAVLLSTTSDRADRQDRLLETMHEYGVDGVLLCPAMGTSARTLERLRAWRLPFVLVVRYLVAAEAHLLAAQGSDAAGDGRAGDGRAVRDAVGVDYVGADNVVGAEMAVEHLLGHGHRRIAMIGGPPNSSARRDRQQGYRSALRRHGVAVDPSLAITSPVTRDGGHQAILKLLELDDPPTAALCYNDVVAFGVMLGLRAAGKVPGRDCAVIGFDDIDEAALWRPALTTVSISPRQIGVKAAELLLERIAHPEEGPRQIIIPPRLIVRKSCGCPAADT